VSTPFYKSSTALAVKRGIRFVMQDLQALADFVQREMDRQNLSTHDVSRRAQGAITHATVWNIQNKVSKEVKSTTLAALAKGLGVTEEAIRSIVYGEKPPITFERFIAELQALGVEDFNAAKGWKKLTSADMEEVLAVARSTVKAMVEQKLKQK
jgi:hypothetical protein